MRYTTQTTTPSNDPPNWRRAGYWCGPNVAEPSNRGDDNIGNRFGDGSFEGTAAMRDHHERMAALYVDRGRDLQDGGGAEK
jgi:hypothetical protein